MSTKKKNKVGRPSKYKPEYCGKLLEFFDIPFFKTITEQRMSASGAVKDIEIRVPNEFPLLEDFCWAVDITPQTITDWCKANPDFAQAVYKAKGMQKRFLAKHGLSGGYNARICTLMAVNLTDIVDKSEVKSENDHTHKGYGLAFDLSKKPEEI